MSETTTVPDLRRLLNEPEVTPGPWTAEGRAVIGPVGFSEMPVVGEDYGVVLREDAALIVAAVNALPQLLAAIEAIQELAERFESNAAHEARFAAERTGEGNDHGAVLGSGMSTGWDLAARQLRAVLSGVTTAGASS